MSGGSNFTLHAIEILLRKCKLIGMSFLSFFFDYKRFTLDESADPCEAVYIKLLK